MSGETADDVGARTQTPIEALADIDPDHAVRTDELRTVGVQTTWIDHDQHSPRRQTRRQEPLDVNQKPRTTMRRYDPNRNSRFGRTAQQPIEIPVWTRLTGDRR